MGEVTAHGSEAASKTDSLRRLISYKSRKQRSGVLALHSLPMAVYSYLLAASEGYPEGRIEEDRQTCSPLSIQACYLLSGVLGETGVALVEGVHVGDRILIAVHHCKTLLDQ